MACQWWVSLWDVVGHHHKWLMYVVVVVVVLVVILWVWVWWFALFEWLHRPLAWCYELLLLLL